MSALADQRVGDFVNRHFVSTYVKVGTFQVVAGQKLLIPRMPSGAVLARSATGIPAATADDVVAAAVVDDDVDEEVSRIVHRVRAGETLYSIARKYQTTIEHLRAVNNLRGSRLRVGARLVIQTGRTAASPQ